MSCIGTSDCHSEQPPTEWDGSDRLQHHQPLRPQQPPGDPAGVATRRPPAEDRAATSPGLRDLKSRFGPRDELSSPFGAGDLGRRKGVRLLCYAITQQWLHQDGTLNAEGLDFIISCCAGELKCTTTEPGREGGVRLGHPSRKCVQAFGREAHWRRAGGTRRHSGNGYTSAPVASAIPLTSFGLRLGCCLSLFRRLRKCTWWERDDGLGLRVMFCWRCSRPVEKRDRHLTATRIGWAELARSEPVPFFNRPHGAKQPVRAPTSRPPPVATNHRRAFGGKEWFVG